MAIGIVEFELALGEFLESIAGDNVPVGSQFLRRPASEPDLGIEFRESGSLNLYDLAGPIDIQMQTYEIECIQRGESHGPGEPSVDLKILTTSVIDALNALSFGDTIGATNPVKVDSMLVTGQTVRVVDDASKGGPQIAYSLTVAANFFATEP